MFDAISVVCTVCGSFDAIVDAVSVAVGVVGMNVVDVWVVDVGVVDAVIDVVVAKQLHQKSHFLIHHCPLFRRCGLDKEYKL